MRWSFVALGALLAVAGCSDDDSPGGGTDAGMAGDTGMNRPDARRDSGPPSNLGSCDSPLTLAAGTLGTPTMITVETEGQPDGDLDLGEGCVNPNVSYIPPQAVIAYVVPGTGGVAVRFTTAGGQTDDDVVTEVAVRRDCDNGDDNGVPACFFNLDGAGPYHADGAIQAMGGETLHFIVTGLPEVDDGLVGEGRITLIVTPEANDPPTVTAASVNVVESWNDRVSVSITGNDAQSNAVGFGITFLDAAGDEVDLNDDGAADEGDTYYFAFDEDITTAAFTGTASIVGFDEDVEETLAARIAETNATQARVLAFDDAFADGEEFGPVAIGAVSEVGLGATCDATHLCDTELMCTTGTCAAAAANIAACMAPPATMVTIATPTTTTTSADVTGSLTPGAGNFTGRCPETPIGAQQGKEVIFLVPVPAGNFDLIATTDVSGTSEDVDTVLYMRGACLDPNLQDEDTCNDDIDFDNENYHSRIVVRNVLAGTVALFVESYGGVDEATPFGMRISLRPVLDPGATCDPAGVNNRCATGTCSSTTMTCSTSGGVDAGVDAGETSDAGHDAGEEPDAGMDAGPST